MINHDPGDEDVPTIDRPPDNPVYPDWTPENTRILRYAIDPPPGEYRSFLHADTVDEAKMLALGEYGRILQMNEMLDDVGVVLLFLRVPRTGV